MGTLYFLTYYQPSQNQALINSYPVTSEPVSLTLSLSSPDNNQLVFDPNLLIQGNTTPPGSTVILSLNDDNQAIETNSRGNFSATVKLQEGINTLSVAVFDNSGNNKREERVVYYSTEKI